MAHFPGAFEGECVCTLWYYVVIREWEEENCTGTVVGDNRWFLDPDDYTIEIDAHHDENCNNPPVATDCSNEATPEGGLSLREDVGGPYKTQAEAATAGDAL